MTFWLNGEWQNNETALDIRDRGFLLGDGVFETILVEHGRAAFLDAHLRRLQQSLTVLKIPLVLPQDMPALIYDLALKNECVDHTATMRMTVTRGVSTRGLPFPEIAAPTLLITLAPMAPQVRRVAEPFSVMISKYRRNTTSLAARHKTLAYLDNIMARQEAIEAGYDDAIMLNEQGAVACASAANIFMILSIGDVLTPLIDDGALPGVVRQILLAQAKTTGVSIRECSIDRDALDDGALFITNSLIGLHPVRLDATVYPAPAQSILNTLKTCYKQALDKSLQQGTIKP